MLIRVVLFAYSRGIVSSLAIAQAYEDHLAFIALAATRRNFRTIAAIFVAVLAFCDRHVLIGREMFAIDGVKLPSNASKHRSGTRVESARRAT
jgi:hypothetical protein